MWWYKFHQVNTQWKPNIYGFSPKFSFIVVCFFFLQYIFEKCCILWFHLSVCAKSVILWVKQPFLSEFVLPFHDISSSRVWPKRARFKRRLRPPRHPFVCFCHWLKCDAGEASEGTRRAFCSFCLYAFVVLHRFSCLHRCRVQDEVSDLDGCGVSSVISISAWLAIL